jgi:SAM-dependent methyltransferase
MKLRLYEELASWWPLLSAPEEYAAEAEVYRSMLLEACRPEPRTLLELGSGGGNNASHLKGQFQLTLVDRAPAMLAVSRALNPECEHVEGDMRDVRLGRTFDAVLIHDAVMYLTGEGDLRRAIETSFVHCRPGGVALFVPDCVRETFVPSTGHGGQDGEGRGLRYLEWTRLAPNGGTYTVDYAFLLHEEGAPVRVEHDRHVCGVFGREDWLRLLRAAGFAPRVLQDPWRADVFVAVRPEGTG